MTRKTLVCLALSLATAALVALPAPASAQGFKWWQNERFKRELALSADQIKHLDEVFQALQPTLKTQKEELDKFERGLSTVINDPASDEAAVLQALERVESARGALSRSRTLMVFRMRRLLTEKQNTRMKELHEEWEKQRRNRPPEHRHDETRL